MLSSRARPGSRGVATLNMEPKLPFAASSFESSTGNKPEARQDEALENKSFLLVVSQYTVVIPAILQHYCSITLVS